MNKLKPCPRCGMNPTLLRTEKRKFRVECWAMRGPADIGCGYKSDDMDTREEAVDNWNNKVGK